MSLSDLASLGSFVSGFAVLVSLVFLYFQVRPVNAQVLQTEKNQRALLQQGRAARAAGIALQVASTPSLADAVQRILAGDRESPRTAFFQFRSWVGAQIQGYEDSCFQHAHGMLDDDVFESTVSTLRRRLVNPGFQAMWRVIKVGAGTAAFREFVDQLADEAEAGAPYVGPFELWKAELEGTSIR
jgi:hypothetical protein